MADDSKAAQHSMLQSKFPVLLPSIFDIESGALKASNEAVASIGNGVEELMRDAPAENKRAANQDSSFMTGLLSDKTVRPSFDEHDGKTLTANGDVAHSTTGAALVDLFHELEDTISDERLEKTISQAWQVDSASTLKIIWNARSIHLGKASRFTFYRAVGWLYQNHPATLVGNLQWLVRPLIQKKAQKQDELVVKSEDADEDFEMVEVEQADDAKAATAEPSPKKQKVPKEDEEISQFDIKYGVAHGYWKDLLNILAIAANDELKVDGNPRSILNPEKPAAKLYKWDWTEGRKKQTNEERHARICEKLQLDGGDEKYKALHARISRLFADQLKLDLARLMSGDKAECKKITFAGKWAPSNKGSHDQHTCVASTIAELLHPFDEVCPDADPADRILYLKHARNAYQSITLSKLRKFLQIVERPITEKKFEDIQYDRVPSLAMKQYTKLFAEKDFDRFDVYLDKVASGQAKISGATLLPSVLVHGVGQNVTTWHSPLKRKTGSVSQMVEEKIRHMQMRATDGQWKSLVQRIKDSGTLESTIAVCDVSGSMSSPRFRDGTCPMDSSIGLSLLLAEVTKPPFGGAFITFSHKPEILRVGGEEDSRTFEEKVNYIRSSDWGYNTDFVKVFDLILNVAKKHNLKQDDMVKQLFVFSDMQFDSANEASDRWTSSFERIKTKFAESGYTAPKLIFWNLNGGQSKPVTSDEENTALVSGYSQGQLKMFLENGSFEEVEEVETRDEETGDVVVEKVKKKDDPLSTVMKAISYDAYRMLKVFD